MAEGLHLPTAAGTLLGVAGAMHLAIGVDVLASDVTLLSTLLVLWGAVAIVGVAATAAGLIPPRAAYAGGIGLLVVSLVGYVDVYALGVSEAVLGVDWQPPESASGHAGGGHHGGGTADATPDGTAHDDGGEDHQASTEQSIPDRLAVGHYALPSKVVELVALGLLVVLVAREPRGRTKGGPRMSERGAIATREQRAERTTTREPGGARPIAGRPRNGRAVNEASREPRGRPKGGPLGCER